MKVAPTWRVLGALAVGLLAGAIAAGQDVSWRDPAVRVAGAIGGLWLDALKMTVIPLIVALLVTGIVGGADAARQGGVAGRSMAWFAILLTGSAIFGALIMPLLIELFPLPKVAALALRAGLAGVDPQATAAAVPGVADVVRSIVPPNVVKAAADGSILQIVVFTTLFAFAIARLPEEKRRPLAEFFDALGQAMLVIIAGILWLAPVGVLALAFAVAAGAGGRPLELCFTMCC